MKKQQGEEIIYCYMKVIWLGPQERNKTKQKKVKKI